MKSKNKGMTLKKRRIVNGYLLLLLAVFAARRVPAADVPFALVAQQDRLHFGIQDGVLPPEPRRDVLVYG